MGYVLHFVVLLVAMLWVRPQIHVAAYGALLEGSLSNPKAIANTLNSATLVNKGLELIETHLLFGIPYDRIEVVVHPQSIVHSMVTFCDGSTIAQASPPDMRLPIALALGWPARVPGAAAACGPSNRCSIQV